MPGSNKATHHLHVKTRASRCTRVTSLHGWEKACQRRRVALRLRRTSAFLTKPPGVMFNRNQKEADGRMVNFMQCLQRFRCHKTTLIMSFITHILGWCGQELKTNRILYQVVNFHCRPCRGSDAPSPRGMTRPNKSAWLIFGRSDLRQGMFRTP